MKWIVEKIDMSSAKSFAFEMIPSEWSLMYIKKRRGPRIEPWETPTIILAHLNDWPVMKLLGFRYEKTFCQNSDKFGYSFIKNNIMFMYLLCIYKKLIILSLFNIDILNFPMHIFTNLTCPLKTYVIRLNNLISMSIYFTKKARFSI